MPGPFCLYIPKSPAFLYRQTNNLLWIIISYEFWYIHTHENSHIIRWAWCIHYTHTPVWVCMCLSNRSAPISHWNSFMIYMKTLRVRNVFFFLIGLKGACECAKPYFTFQTETMTQHHVIKKQPWSFPTCKISCFETSWTKLTNVSKPMKAHAVSFCYPLTQCLAGHIFYMCGPNMISTLNFPPLPLLSEMYAGGVDLTVPDTQRFPGAALMPALPGLSTKAPSSPMNSAMKRREREARCKIHLRPVRNLPWSLKSGVDSWDVYWVSPGL